MIKINLRIKNKSIKKRMKTKARIRKKIYGSSKIPRLSVFRTNKNLYAQLIDDDKSKVLASASTIKEKQTANCELAKKVGESLAQQALALKIKKVVFDRNGFIYHGRVKQIAESCRKAGLSF